MRVLWVKAGKLLPVNKGTSIRSYNISRHLARRNEITFLSYYSGERDAAYERDLAQLFAQGIAIPTQGSRSNSLGEATRYIWRFPTGLPFAVSKFTSPEVQRVVADLMNRRAVDIAICDFLAASLNFPRVPKTPTILFQHNVESVLWRRQAETERHWIRKPAYRIEAARMLRYERLAVGRFDHIIAVSEEDRKRMGSMTDLSRITVIPTGVDVQAFQQVESRIVSEPRVMFLGDMSWEPNIDGAMFFCKEIWPRVKGQVPDARFQIVGRDPSPSVKKLASPSVEVTGTVPSALEYLREAAVFVVPLRVGSGTRLKIYEAMAAGRAVVSTSIGAEGLDVHPGRDIILADSAETFADAIIQLLRDLSLRRRYEAAAIELVRQFDWSLIASQFEEVMARVASRTPLAKP